MTNAELDRLKASISDKVMQSRIGAIATSTYAHVVRDHIAYAVVELAKKLENVTSFTVNGSEVTLEQFVTGIVDKQLSTYAKNDDLTSTNGNVTALTERVAELENDQADSRLTTAENNISSLQNAVFDTNGASLIAAIQEAIDNIEQAITNITGTSVEVSSLSMESLYNDIGELRSTTTSQGESIANLETRVTELSQNPAQSADIESLQNSVETLEDQNLDARLKTIEETHVQTIAEHTDEIEALQNSAGIHETLSADKFDTYGYLRTNGQVPYSEPYGTSDFIPVIPGEEITVEHQSVGSAYYIVLYDELKNWFDSVQSTVQANSRVQTQVVVPEGAYYMRVSAPRENPKIDIYRNVNNLKKITDEANIQIGNHVRYHDGTDLEFTMTENQRVWINDETSANLNSSPNPPPTITLNGETYPAYWKSDIIDISGYDRLELRAPITNASAGYAFLTGYQVIAAGGSPTGNRNGSLATFMLDVPEGADGFIFSCYIGQNVLTEYLERIVNELTTHQYDLIMLRGYVTGKNYQNGSKAFYESARTNYPPYEHLMYGTIVCIGDSLTVGALPKGNTNTDNNYSGVATVDYPTWINQLSTLPTAKRAVSGCSASSWWNDDNMSKDFNSPAYIIWLGTNEGPTGIPAESFSDEPADTELYYYRKIIEEIKTAVPNAKIFLGHVFSTKTNNGDIRPVNQCIDAIAAAYPDNVVGVARMDDGSLYGPTKGYLHGGMPRNPHFSNAGYMYLANKWLSEIRRCIAERIDMF